MTSEREKLQYERRTFIAAMGALFPHMSDTMVVKCWRSTDILPPNYRTALGRDLLRAAMVTISEREDLAKLDKTR